MPLNSAVFADLLFLAQSVFNSPDLAVKKWSQITCRDFQIPVIRLVSFLKSFERQSLPISDVPEHQIIYDIVTNSHLATILEYNIESKAIIFRQCINNDTRTQVRNFLLQHSPRGVVN